MLIFISIFIASCLAITFAGGKAVHYLIEIAKSLKWKEFTVASVLMALVTCLPEIFIAISSALHKKPQLSLGNVIGHNIAVLTLIMGMGALLANDLKFEGKALQRSSFYTALIATLPFLLLLDGKITRWDGLILMVVPIFYFFYIFSQEKKYSKIISNKKIKKPAGFWPLFRNLTFFFFSAALLLVSAEGIVLSASRIAEGLGLSLAATGVVLVALGSSTPEIIFGIKAISAGRQQMVLGNLMGAVVINSSFVLGLTALICPFQIINLPLHFIGFGFTLVVIIFFVIFAKTEHKITQKEAMLLVFFYLAFIITQMLVK